MTELQAKDRVLLGRLQRLKERLKDIKDGKDYTLYADEGGFIGTPSFFLIENNSVKRKAPKYHQLQCSAKGSFMKGYISRLVDFWQLGGSGDFLNSFKIEVVNE